MRSYGKHHGCCIRFMEEVNIMRFNDVLQKLTGQNIWSEIGVGKVPLLELTGDCRILIENYQGISQYSDSCISVLVKYGCLTITGEKLKLLTMNREQAVVSGCIHEIRIIRGNSQ